MKTPIITLAVVLLHICNVGCVSFLTRVCQANEGGSATGIYPGVRVAGTHVKAWVDIPGSFALDTILLPYDLVEVARDSARKSARQRLETKHQQSSEQNITLKTPQ